MMYINAGWYWLVSCIYQWNVQSEEVVFVNLLPSREIMSLPHGVPYDGPYTASVVARIICLPIQLIHVDGCRSVCNGFQRFVKDLKRPGDQSTQSGAVAHGRMRDLHHAINEPFFGDEIIIQDSNSLLACSHGGFSCFDLDRGKY